MLINFFSTIVPHLSVNLKKSGPKSKEYLNLQKYVLQKTGIQILLPKFSWNPRKFIAFKTLLYKQ